MTARLLVFGGTGFLGRHIVARASADGYDVHATHLDSPEIAGQGCTWHRSDITDIASIGTVVSAASPEIIINAAYKQRGPRVHEICADAPTAMARLAHDTGARFVQLSTDLVFDGKLGRPYREGDPTSPLGEYGEAKVDAEVRVLAEAPNAAIVRTSLIYGAPDAPQEQLVRKAHDDGDVAFFTDEWRTAVHVDDLAQAVLALAAADHAGIIHIAGEERQNRLEFARVLASALGLDPNRLVGRTQDPSLGPRAQDVSLDTSLASSLGLSLPGPTDRLAAGYA